MKKLLLIPVLLFVLKVQAQEGAAFKIKYQPNRTYDGTVSLNVVCHANLSGNDSVIAKITAKGLKLPLALNVGVKGSMSTKTGAASADHGFPATMKVNFDTLGVEMNGNKLPIPMGKFADGISEEGLFSKDGVFEADSSGGKGIADSMQLKIKQMTSGFQRNIKFPDHPMKIGESFTQALPFNLPVTISKLKIDAKATYTLTKIEDGKAYFDVSPSIDISISIKGNILNITGTGSGKMVYSIKENFATDYNSIFNMKVKGEIDKLKVDANLDMQMAYDTTITVN